MTYYRMGTFRIFSAFDDFKGYWSHIQDAPLADQIAGYGRLLEEKWPELFQMQVENYHEDGHDWRAIAVEHVFPKLPAAYPHMAEIHNKLQVLIPGVFEQAVNSMQFDFDINFVIYVGFGVGAGWATKYRGKRAVLHGIENIIDCGWSTVRSLSSLCAHEIGHLVHQEWRDQHALPNIPNGKDPFWDLYEERFAMRAEHKIMGEEVFHEAEGQENWVEWCADHRDWLAREYLASIARGEENRRFFGSWYDIEGYKQTGYYLGHEILKLWENKGGLSFHDIGLLLLGEIEIKVKETLDQWASNC